MLANVNPREINREIELSQLPLNRHLVLVPAFFSHFTVTTILSIRRTTATFETINGQFGGALCNENSSKRNAGVPCDSKLQNV